MGKKLSEISQPLGALVDDFHVCQSCGFVKRGRIPYPCSHCGQGSEGQPYFNVPTVPLINLMQSSYQQKSIESHRRTVSDDDLQLAVLIFFCTFVEVLVENFLLELMKAKEIPIVDRRKKLKTKKYYWNRTDQVFKELVNEEWSDVIEVLSKDANVNYENTLDFYKKVEKYRQGILHSGTAAAADQPETEDDKIRLGVPQNYPKMCIDDGIMPLMDLFVALHNRYVPALYISSKRKYGKAT